MTLQRVLRSSSAEDEVLPSLEAHVIEEDLGPSLEQSILELSAPPSPHWP